MGAASAILVNAPAAYQRKVEAAGVPTKTLGAAKPISRARALVKALRPHQWIKNALLFAPITLAQQLGDTPRLLDTLLGFVAFSCIASVGYLVNDLLDIEADRVHETKCNRPFAAGTLPIPTGIATAGILLCIGFGLAVAFVSLPFVAMLGIYLTATLAYSFYLKERLFLDVLVLAGLYTHRVLAGGVAADVMVSTWLLAFSVFFFLSLALVKRYVELLAKEQKEPNSVSADGDEPEASLSRRAYHPIDLGLIETMGVTAGYLSILVLGLYVSRDDVTQFYAQPELLWLITPLMLYWISRVWFLARRGELNNDPVLFAATDRISYCVVAGVGVIGAIAAVWGK
jgi:4-hydroxybenzoate polyprenyltransferase